MGNLLLCVCGNIYGLLLQCYEYSVQLFVLNVGVRCTHLTTVDTVVVKLA